MEDGKDVAIVERGRAGGKLGGPARANQNWMPLKRSKIAKAGRQGQVEGFGRYYLGLSYFSIFSLDPLARDNMRLHQRINKFIRVVFWGSRFLKNRAPLI